MILILGTSNSGKSTLARAIQDHLFPQEDVSVISAGEWARNKFNIYEKTKEAAAELWFRTNQYLENDPEAVRDWISAHMETCRPIILEGCRNLKDVIHAIKLRPIYSVAHLMPTASSDGWEIQKINGIIDTLISIDDHPNCILHIPSQKWTPSHVSFLAEQLLRNHTQC